MSSTTKEVAETTLWRYQGAYRNSPCHVPAHAAKTMTFIPDPAVLVAYSIACLVMFVTPGPDMSLFLARTLAGGSRAGIAAMAGTMAGCCVHTLLAAVGLSALLAASETAFTVMKLVGAVYLAWLAVDAIRNGSSLNVRTERRGPVSLRKSFWVGVGVNLTNPKVVLFFVTFLPQFVAASDPHAAGKLVFLGLYYIAFSVPLAILLIVGAQRVVGALKARPRALRAIDWLFAGVFGAFAVKILMTQTR
jgi:threonine/homoserine/homoserine lactone efflux protein